MQHYELMAWMLDFPNGQMGNSEVGHVNLGAGRVVYQDLAKINMAVEKDTLKDESVLQTAFKTAKQNKVKLHFIGLVSDGGVHAHINHIKGLVQAAKQAEVPEVFVHAFTDGRDVDPKSGAAFITELQEWLCYPKCTSCFCDRTILRNGSR